MINLIMIIIHILALLFALPALLITIPLHILIAKSGVR